MRQKTNKVQRLCGVSFSTYCLILLVSTRCLLYQAHVKLTVYLDVHFRVGGAAGSHLQEADCPKLTGSVNPNCIAGSLMLHMTQSSSGYLENVWAWVADHELDGGPSQTQIDIYVARGEFRILWYFERIHLIKLGILIESTTGPVWLYGTSSEHSVLYQYMVYEATNVVMSMVIEICFLSAQVWYNAGFTNTKNRFKRKAHTFFLIHKPQHLSKILATSPPTQTSQAVTIPTLTVQQRGACQSSAAPM